MARKTPSRSCSYSSKSKSLDMSNDQATESFPLPTRYKLDLFDKTDSLQTFELRKGSGLAALKAKKSALEFDCLDADCGICVVRVLKHPEHLSPMDVKERDFLTAMGADPEERLACQCRIMGDVTIKVEF